MNRFVNILNPSAGIMALLVAIFVTGCSSAKAPDAVALATDKAVTSFSLEGNVGTINETSKTVGVTVPFGTNLTSLTATFLVSAGSNVKIGSVMQNSGTSANNFTSSVAYIVTAADASTATYNVLVAMAPSSAKAITSYALTVGGVSVTGVINSVAKTVALTVPFGTSLAALVATYSSTGSNVKIGAATQSSGATANNFTSPVSYIVTAVDASTATYVVTVSVAPSTAKVLTAFSFVGFPEMGTINETAKTVLVLLPRGTDLTNLIANFSSTGSNVKIGAVMQSNGITANNFTSTVSYIVTAANATTATYVVTLAIEGINLGTSGNFVILSETGVSSTTPSVITGNIGASPVTGAAVIVTCSELVAGAGIGQIFTDDAAPSTSCVSGDKSAAGIAVGDMVNAYNYASDPATPAGVGPYFNVGAGTIGLLTFGPGVYTWTTVLSITDDITLNGGPNDIWIFQIAGTLTLATAKNIILTGGAKAKNVYWQTGGAVAMGTASTFKGIVLGGTSIAMGDGATIEGRLYGQTRVDIGNNTVTQPVP